MKKLLTVTALSVALMLVVLPVAFAQEKAAPPSQTNERVFEGQLAKVDVDAKQITVQGADKKLMMFLYTDTTEIVGPDRTVQGLAGKPGTQLKVTYRDSEGKQIATKIEPVTQR